MRFTAALIAFVGVAEAHRFKSGAVTGYEKFTYGKFITRMKAPNKKGTVSSFFTYWNGPDFYPGGWNELDVEIVPSVEQNPFSMNIIYGDGHNKHETHDYKRSFDPKDEWHIYEMAWTPEYVAWSIDNKEVRRVTKSDPSVDLLNKGQSVMMNFWTPTFESWGKGFKAEAMPWYVLYDYVETYTWNSETNGFDFHWRDDFVTFDANRWHKSDNTTFDANSTTFRASQAYIDHGHLVLKMEPDVPEQLHHGQHFEPTVVEPVETEPTYEHTPAKGKKAKKGDEHYDVLEEQHHSHFEHAHYPHEARPVHHGDSRYYEEGRRHGVYEGARYADPYGYGPHAYYTPTEAELYRHDPYSLREYEVAADPYAAAAFHHADAPYGSHQVGGAEPVGAHLAAPHHSEVHHEVPVKHDEHGAEPIKHGPAQQGPHDATPIHAASAEVHVSSEPAYYDQMFHPGQRFDGINQAHDHSEYTGYPGALRRHEVADAHVRDAQRHHPEVSAFGVQRNLTVRGSEGLSHLDETPYEHDHSDYEARFLEHDRVPHHERAHDEHGVEEVVEAVHHMPTVPSYSELLWAYQHGAGVPHEGGYHHREDHSEVVHHEDVAAEEHYSGAYHEREHAPVFRPHLAEEEYVMDHGDQHVAPHHYVHERESHQAEVEDFREAPEQRYYHEDRHYENPEHHQGGPFWRGDHYDDHHLRDEDYRHDSEQHAYHPGDAYGHDVDYHDGKQVMHDIEHEYDELFHQIEAETKHGVEHRDVTYKTLPLHQKEHEVVSHPVAVSEHEYTPHDHTEGHIEREVAHHGQYVDHSYGLEKEHAFGHVYGHGHGPEYSHEGAGRTHVPTYYDQHYHAEEGPQMYSWSIHPEDEGRRIAEQYHRVAYHDPVIHGDHGSSEYHELDHEPFHGDVHHGDLHFEPYVKGEHHVDKAPHHMIAYPHHEAPHVPESHHEEGHIKAEAQHDPHHQAPAHDAPHQEAAKKEVAAKPAKDEKKVSPQPAKDQKAAPAQPKATPQQPAVAKKLEHYAPEAHDYVHHILSSSSFAQ